MPAILISTGSSLAVRNIHIISDRQGCAGAYGKEAVRIGGNRFAIQVQGLVALYRDGGAAGEVGIQNSNDTVAHKEILQLCLILDLNTVTGDAPSGVGCIGFVLIAVLRCAVIHEALNVALAHALAEEVGERIAEDGAVCRHKLDIRTVVLRNRKGCICPVRN